MICRYKPGRVLGLFDGLLELPEIPEDHRAGWRESFYAGVRRAVGTGDLSPLRVQTGRVNSNITRRMRLMDRYVLSMYEMYGALHPGPCMEGVRMARAVLSEMATYLGVKMEKRQRVHRNQST